MNDLNVNDASISDTPPGLIPVVLSGGSGSRLWPMSRKLHPKQFIALIDQYSLFQDTLKRLAGLAAAPPIIVANHEHRFMVAEQLRQVNVAGATILLEPEGRNTAPAIALAALEVLAQGGDGILLVLPADHLIKDQAAFHRAVQDGAKAAAAGYLVTLGVVPERAETGFGYIRQGERIELAGATQEVWRVANFVEKPNEELAHEYLLSGGYLWNSGMFIMRASCYLEELSHQAPAIHEACTRTFEQRTRDLDFIRLPLEDFAQSPSISVDYAVMEKTAQAVVVALRAGWSDVGSWHALWEVQPVDADNNLISGDVLAHDTKGCYLRANHRLVATVGIEDLVVVETADAVLIAPRARAQDIRGVVDALTRQERPEALVHRKVFRPWGAYECIDYEQRFQVKRITVNPQQSLSLQMHHHRAEHWVVVKGTARVTRNDEVFLVSENESVYIPIGARHRLENPGLIPLEMIEVQSGSYLGEDDITRFVDNYGR